MIINYINVYITTRVFNLCCVQIILQQDLNNIETMERIHFYPDVFVVYSTLSKFIVG